MRFFRNDKPKGGEVRRMSQPPNAEDVTASLPLLLPPLLCALLTGVLFEMSQWFGCTIVILLITEFVVIRRIVKARKVTIKMFEVAVMGLLIPMLATQSVLSSFHFPPAINTLNLMLISVALPHLALIWRARTRVNHPFILLASATILVSGLVATGLFYARGLATITPTITVSIYSLAVICGTALIPRKKITTCMQRRASFVLFSLLLVSSIICYFTAFLLFYGLVTATVAAYVLFSFFDYRYHEENAPEDWPADGFAFPTAVLSLKLSAVAIIACWAGFGVFMRTPKPFTGIDFLLFLVNLFILTAAHALFPLFIMAVRAKEPSLPKGQPINIKTVFGLSAIVSVVCAMISIAAFYCQSVHPTVIHEKFYMMTIALLFVILIGLLDYIRAFLVRFYHVITIAVSGIAVYLMVYSMVHSAKQPPVGKTRAENEQAEDFEPIERVAFMAVVMCIGVIWHCITAAREQGKKEERAQTPAVGSAASATVQRDVDSDYNSDEN